MAELVSTGIERLDEALIDEKGVNLGSCVLIEGTSGSGKELLSKQFASAGVGSENVVYFSTDETSDELIETFEQYRWPTDLRIVNVGTQYFEKVLSRELQASRLLTYWAASLRDQGKDYVSSAAIAKMYATEAAERASLTAIKLCGSAGVA